MMYHIISNNSKAGLPRRFAPRNDLSAFTLSEVLITLGIIGIVAAMTMPVLMSNYRKQVTATKLKQTYSILLNATNKKYLETGIPFSSYYISSYYGEAGVNFSSDASILYNDYLKENMSKNVIELEHGLGGDYDYFDRTVASVTYGKGFVLPNGTGVNIYGGAFAVVPDFSLNKKKKIKLVPGKNLFNFGTYHMGTDYDVKNRYGTALSPMPKNLRKSLTREDLKTQCNSSVFDTSMIACTQLFIEDDFQFKDDYPIKF